MFPDRHTVRHSSSPAGTPLSIHVAIDHRTTYRYDRPVVLGPQVVRLRPAPHCRTPIISWSLTVEPAEHFVNWQQDAFGNHLGRFVFPDPTQVFSVRVDLVADMTTINPFDFFVEEDAEQWGWSYDADLRRDLAPYLVADDTGPLLDAWVDAARGELNDQMRTIDVLVHLNARVNRDIAYTTRMEPGVQTPEVTLGKAIGSCRDSGWLLVQALRQLGLAARFASGYLIQLTADIASLDGPSGPTADFTDLHAWCEVFIPGAGWVGLDPTSGLFAGEGHIPLACTPSPSTAAPITGAMSTGGAEVQVEFQHANEVFRVHEDPRVTKPYSRAQWKAIDALGHKVDEMLVEGDVRLTMGGEPTFVSIDDMEAPQWNTTADGGDKRELAWDLTQRLADRFGTGALVQHGQGKWYPGEPLPRWQYGIAWLRDGTPLWRDATTLADPNSVVDETGHATTKQALKLAKGVATALGVDPGRIVAAHEDALYDLWSEASLPHGDGPEVDLDPTDPSLRERGHRTDVVARLDAAGEPVGYALPLHHDHDGWHTTRWRFRRGALNLITGDSPMGLRLPLGSLAWEDEKDVHLGALTVEVRHGLLHVFLPPCEELAEFRQLLDALQDVVAAQRVRVVVEGYAPPGDPDLVQLTVAPDPGVIEVNIHPAASWDELSTTITGLYEDAHRSRLGTEKFDLDGAHTGTGGGNHITIGATHPEDSPVLRRPDLLRSLITFWQHHPSLSYLFSSKFIGPTSQAPRVDEGRDDRLHHLEIAFAEIGRLEGDPRPWLVDRLLRNLLTDLTGNTHRSEFCIDKMYSPTGERGRLGLLELRGFEMPPHPEMALAQALLVRALVARFWDEPYTAPLVRWGTLLHDRFLLPRFVEQDLDEVCAHLAAGGIAFERAWLAPFTEFRFPRAGTFTVDAPGGTPITVELRAGIEPWDVLGEEVTSMGTARFVDSSMERMQVLVTGDVPGRHLLTVNGRPLELHPTSEPGVSVAGVRFRAWAPPSGLHPTIGVHAPLTFDVVDRFNERSLGGARYHVSHPGGRSYETFPVNALEAEARRAARFLPYGHTPGRIDISTTLTRAPAATDFPVTFDLRLAERGV